MCGIAGVSVRHGARGTADIHRCLEAMNAAMAHRGPDDAGIWVSEADRIGLAHRRLSIIDLSPHGHQPMRSADGNWVMAYNGELYNTAELRARLGGAALQGHSDTEVLLEHIARFGIIESLQRANGMFAFAIWNVAQRELILARDRFGEKPLYLGWLGDRFVFASELASIMKVARPGELTIDRTALGQYLSHSAVPAPRSIFTTIRKVSPGTFQVAPLDRPGAFGVEQRYWDAAHEALLAAEHPTTGSSEERLDELDAILSRAVEDRMVSDVPLGAFLSGGIDSSLVVALMQRHSSRPVQTFSIGFEQPEFDESGYATEVARHLGTDHTNLIVSDERLLNVVPTLARLYSEPFADSSQIPTYLVSELARSQVTVALSGDAGDELFGGYDRYRTFASMDRKIAKLPPAVATRLGNALRRVRPERYDALARRVPQALARRIPPHLGAKVHKAGSAIASGAADAYGQMMVHWPITEPPVLDAVVEPTLPFRRGDWPGTGSPYSDAMLVDTFSYLPDDILTKVDRAAMGVSLETRIPLLDPAVFRFAWSLGHADRSDGRQSKVILRQLLDRYVPRALVDRPKKGFGVPLASWLSGPLRSWANDLLAPDALGRGGLLDPAPIRHAWDEHLAGRGHYSYMLWDVLMFQAWRDQWQQ